MDLYGTGRLCKGAAGSVLGIRANQRRVKLRDSQGSAGDVPVLI
jgi:hypothetical protein